MFYFKTVEDEMGLWLVEDKYNSAYTNKMESVFANQNGYLGVRATHDFKGINEKKGMFVSGLFQKASKEEVIELVNCPDIAEIKLSVNDEVLSLDICKIENYNRKFNVYTGEVRLECVCGLKNNEKIKIKSSRVASLWNRHIFTQRISVKALENDLELQFINGINGQVTNSGVTHFRKIECLVLDKKVMKYQGRTDQNTLDIVMATQFHGGNKVSNAVYGLQRRSIYETNQILLEKGKTITLEKCAYINHDMDKTNIQFEEKKNIVKDVLALGYKNHLKMHTKVTEQFWRYANIKIDGLPLDQKAAILYSQFQLYGMTPDNTEKISIAAKGLTGEGYKGHVFWDTEIYMLPFFYSTFPDKARNLLMYRYHGLNGAFEKAKEYGYEGAMYPWESAVDGGEETPKYAALNIHTGKANKVWSGIKEHHVTVDIEYAIIKYFGITKDYEFLMNYGLEMLVEASRFWVSRLTEKAGRFELLDIIGPDEYNEHINNNAYTNYMVYYCTRETLRLLDKMKIKNALEFEQLQKKTSLEELIPRMEDLVSRIYLPKPNTENIIPMDDEFMDKPELPNIEKYRKSQIKQSILVDYSRDEVVNMRVLKQADTVMLLNLLPEVFTEDVVKDNVKFYEKRTLHDSSLSYCAHAQALAMIGEIENSMEFFEKSLEVDLCNNPHDSTDGLHAAALGGVWNIIINGFAGFNHSEKGMKLSPNLPKNWNSIEFHVKMRGTFIKVICKKTMVELKAVEKLRESFIVEIYGKEYKFNGNGVYYAL